MPDATMGHKNNLDRDSLFIELSNKDDWIRVRFVKQDYYYEGKHFEQVDDKWNVSECEKINADGVCELCDKYDEIIRPKYELRKKIKDLGDSEVTFAERVKLKEEIERLETKAKPYKVNISFYYPVIDRAIGRARILKTVMTVRIALEKFLKNGDDVLSTDYEIVRTEVTNGYYTITPLDKPIEFSDEENSEYMKALGWNMGDLVNGRKSDFNMEKQDPDLLPANSGVEDSGYVESLAGDVEAGLKTKKRK